MQDEKLEQIGNIITKEAFRYMFGNIMRTTWSIFLYAIEMKTRFACKQPKRDKKHLRKGRAPNLNLDKNVSFVAEATDTS